MTRVIFHGSIQTFRGRLGDMIFCQLPDGTTVVTKAPPKKTRRQKKRAKLKRSPAQKAHNSHFQDASAYAKWAAKTKPIYAELAATTPMMTAYNFALSDWFEAPVIHCIEKKEECIRVQATDNVMVARVRVSLLDEDGKIIEAVEGIQSEGNWWEVITATQAQGRTVVAEAWDLPENMTQLVA